LRSSPRIEAFWFDDENVEKFAAHGLTDLQVDQVLENEHVVVRNRKRRRAQYLVIGTDHGGTCIAVPIEKTPEPGVWRPVTAWRCKASERSRLA
jgi:hypothetical protein